MARRVDYTRAHKIRAPGVPRGGKGPQRVFERKGMELRPLAGPEIPIPGEGEEDLLAAYAAWRGRTNGSLPEYIVWKWLVNIKKQIEGTDFIFQYAILGGRTQFGGAIADFYFPGRMEIWNVQGLRFHRTNPDDRARDMIFKQLMAAQGLTVIFLWEDDLFLRPDFVLDLAWRGQQVAGREVTA